MQIFRSVFCAVVLLFVCPSVGCNSGSKPNFISSPIKRFPGTGALAFSPDGRYFFSGKELRTTSDWSVVFELPTNPPGGAMWASFSTDSQVLSVLSSGVVSVVDVPNRKVVFDRPVNGAIAASYDPESQTVFSIDSNGTVRRWSREIKPSAKATDFGEPLEVVVPDLEREAMDFGGVDISEASNLAAVANETQIRFFKTNKLEEVSVVEVDLPRMAMPRNVVKISPEGSRAAFTNGSDARIVKIDNSAKQVKIFTYPKGPIIALDWCRNGSILAAVCFSHDSGNICVQFFNAENGDTLGIVPVHGHQGTRYGRMAVGGDHFLATCGADNAHDRDESIVKIWDYEVLLTQTLKKNPPYYEETIRTNR
ncbi:MAG: WD40 repeat domain-containing protein [Pirellulales bacterium]